MKYKSMFTLVLAIFLLSMASVCASDLNDTTSSSEGSTMELSQADSDKKISAEENELISQRENEEMVSEGNVGTFTELQYEINVANASTLTLNRDYAYDDSFDTEGILINKSITIDGNGFKIDAKDKSRIFNITSKNVMLKNIIFTNGKTTEYGGAIRFDGSGTVTNCSFINNTAPDGGALYFKSNGEVTYCNFTNNVATNYDGGAIYIDSGTISYCNFAGNSAKYGGAIRFEKGRVINCNFTNNKAQIRGGGVYFYNYCTLINCSFINNSARSGGGAVYFRNIQNTMSGCNFINNSANDGGAVYFRYYVESTNCIFTNNNATNNGGAVYSYEYGKLTNCNFTNNFALNESGAVYFKINGGMTNCDFRNNVANKYGGAIGFDSGTVMNCSFINNSAPDGGALYFKSNGEVTYCNFTNNVATNYDGGAIYIDSGIISYCNFAGNSAKYGGAVRLDTGRVINCNFTNNRVIHRGAGVYFNILCTLINCDFTNNSALNEGGAVYFKGTNGTVRNCNFNNNTARRNGGGAVYFNVNYADVKNCNFTNNHAIGNDSSGGAIKMNSGNVINCNFTNNTAKLYGGAIKMDSGNVLDCNFINNSASIGGAISFNSECNGLNCNFINNSALAGGAVFILRNCNMMNCDFIDNKATGAVAWGGALCFEREGIVTLCNFTDNSAKQGGAIFSYRSTGVVSDTCIFKTTSDTTFNTTILSPSLNVDNFTTFYNSGVKLIFNLTTNRNMSVPNGIISIRVYFKDNGSFVRNYSCLSGDGLDIDLSVGDYYAIFDTEYAEFQPISRTIKITIPDVQYYINVTSLSTSNKTLNITAESNIPKNLFWNGKLLFILSDGTEINANYGADGTWWAVHTFDDYDEYNIDATYVGLDNVIVNSATVNITKQDSTITLDDLVLDYGESMNVAVETTGAIGITAKIDNIDVTVVNKFTIQISGLDAGNHTLTITTMTDDDHNPVTKEVYITVNKVDSTLTVDNITFDYDGVGSTVVSFAGAEGIGAIVVGQPGAIVKVNGANIAVSGLNAGTYTLTVTAIADANHNNVTKNATITVNKLKTEISGNAVTAIYNVNKYLVITLKDSTGKALSGVKVTVDLNGAKTYTTDGNGQVKVTTKGLTIKTYTAKVTFNGDINYEKSAKDVKVTVKKATPKLTAKKKTFKKSVKVKKYKIVLKNNLKKAIKKAKVYIKIGKKTYKAKTNAKGKATFKIKKLTKKGKYKAKITYKGNKYYNKVTKKVKITVK